LFDLKGKVALVAGGAGWLGAASCAGLAKQGATVVIGDIMADKARAVAEEISAKHPNAKVEGLLLDITDEKSISSVVAHTAQKYGGMHILVNATYWLSGKSMDSITPEEFDATLHNNITSSFILAREAYKVMGGGGSIVMFSSVYGVVVPDPRFSNPLEYSVAKAGLIQLVRQLATYWGPKGIRVNAIVPGAFPHKDMDKEAAAQDTSADYVPLRRAGHRHEIVGAVVFLASDESSYVTGQALHVDGGWTIW